MDLDKPAHSRRLDSPGLTIPATFASSARDASRELWLSPKTVETHIRGAFAKLGIKEAAEDNRRVLAVLTYMRR